MLEEWSPLQIFKWSIVISTVVNIIIQIIFLVNNLDVPYVALLCGLLIVFFVFALIGAWFEQLHATLIAATGLLVVAILAFIQYPAIIEFVLFLLMVAIVYGFAYLLWKQQNS
jgi:hypothetical protein